MLEDPRRKIYHFLFDLGYWVMPLEITTDIITITIAVQLMAGRFRTATGTDTVAPAITGDVNSLSEERLLFQILQDT